VAEEKHHRQATADLPSLLSRASLGDRSAFSALYNATAPYLLGQIMRLQRNRSQAEDVLQEVFVKVWRSAGSFDAARSQPQTWLASIARHCTIDSLRRQSSQPQLHSLSGAQNEDGEEVDLLHQFAADEPGPEQRWQHGADAASLRRCLRVLSNEQSQAMTLAFYQGLSYSEVAEHLRQPLGTIKSWVRRGLASLKTCLEQATG
jgi:RNA polymerase sigma-70 factor (ECF subfamily)